MRRQNLDGDIAPQPRIASAINFAHAARSERRLNFIRPEFCASGKAHGWLELYRVVSGQNGAHHVVALPSCALAFFVANSLCQYSSGSPLSITARTLSIKHSRLPKFPGSIGG